ncbi:MAG TPA: glycosyltransferase family 4 protein [Pyrinomonadaceae bacterium]
MAKGRAGEEREAAGAAQGACGQTPLRVLIVAPSMDILGGQAVQAERLMDGLKQEPSLSVSFLPINPRLPGVLRHLQAIKYVRTVVTSVFYLATLLARVGRYDVIHIFSASYFSFLLAPTPAMLIARLYGRKIVLNYHSGEAEDHLTRWRRTALPLLRLAHLIVVPSGYLVDVFARFNLKSRAIFNHLETGRFRQRERRVLRPVFLSNRNLEAHYNVACVLRAFALIQQRLSTARLIVAGDGSQRGELEALARKLNLKQTEFVGSVTPEKMVELYDAADIYLNASEIDNMPLSILEAYASGLPVVTSDAGGIPYIVTNEETGLLVPKGDHKALAAAALRLLENPELALRMATRAAAECRKYGWPVVRDEWLKLYYGMAREATESPEQSAAGSSQKEVGCEQKTALRGEEVVSR